MAFKAVNDTAGPDGIVPTLLVFRAYPRLVESDAPSSLTVSHRATVIKKAMEEVRKLRAKRQVNDALNHRNGPSTSALKDLPLNSLVLVWHETPGNKAGHWTGPFSLLGINNEDCIVALPSGPTTFRSTAVKPYFQEKKGQEPGITENQEDEDTITVELPLDYTHTPQITAQPPKRRRGRPRKVPLLDTNTTDLEAYISTADTQFEQSRQKEVNGLIDKGVFQLVHKIDIPQGIRIFNSRFMDKIKNKGTDQAFKKS